MLHSNNSILVLSGKSAGLLYQYLVPKKGLQALIDFQKQDIFKILAELHQVTRKTLFKLERPF
jgi:hypothetical protein